MLRELQISDFAIITDLDLTFHPRFNVFTGETGAGKSIIIDALGIVLGGRASPEMVRTGAAGARVQALFELDGPTLDRLRPACETYGVDVAEGLILSREVSATGRSTARVNGVLVPVAVLREVAEGLVDITGQSEHLSLLRPAAQLRLLDQYARTEPLRSEVSELYSRARAIETRISSLVHDRQEAERRADMLRYQTEEIESAGLGMGEEQELTQQRTLLSNAERLTMLAENAYQSLYSASPSGLDQLRQAQSSAEELVRLDPSLQPDLDLLVEAALNVEEIALTVRRYRDSVEYDPALLSQIEDRLDQINRLKRKYGGTIDEIVAFAATASVELETLEHSDELAEQLRVELATVHAQLAEKAVELSARRTEAAAELGGGVEAALADLLMARARVEVQVRRRPACGETVLTIEGERVGVDSAGIDVVEIMLSPNPGEPLKSMARIASGGETSRILLAVRSVLSDADRTPSLVFDEVDVGVGGRSGHVVGEKLYGLTGGHQVLTITHLAQVASFADAHYRITKRIADGRTSTVVDRLDEAEARTELAAMLGGPPVTERSLHSADELISRSAEWKRSLSPVEPGKPRTKRRTPAAVK